MAKYRFILFSLMFLAGILLGSRETQGVRPIPWLNSGGVNPVTQKVDFVMGRVVRGSSWVSDETFKSGVGLKGAGWIGFRLVRTIVP